MVYLPLFFQTDKSFYLWFFKKSLESFFTLCYRSSGLFIRDNKCYL